MAVTMAEITKLRKISGAGMMDCKNALTEANGDIDKAMEIIRKKGQAVAAKRSDREASEGCVLAKKSPCPRAGSRFWGSRTICQVPVFSADSLS